VPTETLANLRAEKQKRIFDAAVSEFSMKRFSQASINQIIKMAGISRGSFYQYFSDKEDLYLYLLTEIGKEKVVIAKQTKALYPEADWFEVHRYMTQSILNWARERPLYHQISLLMDLDDSDFISKLRQSLPDGVNQLTALIKRDQQRGLIRPEVDPALIVEIFNALLLHLSKEYYKTGCNEAMLLRKMAAIHALLKEGISRV